MARPEKTAVVEEIQRKLGESDASVLTEYRGLSVSALAELRGALRPAGTEYKVFKNTLARRAAEAAGLTDLMPLLEGPVAIAFVHGDAAVAAKALKEFGRTNPELVLKGGLLGTRVLTPADLSALAEIQPREVLLARLAGGFQAPLTKAAGLFQAFTRNFAYGLKAYADQRVASEGASAAGVSPAVADEPVEVSETADAPAAEATAETTEDAAPEAAAQATDAGVEAPAAADETTSEES